MKCLLDTQLQDQQPGFRKDRSYTDPIMTLWFNVEQSSECNITIYRIP